MRSQLPEGFGIRLDDSTSEVTPGVLVGGQPLRVLRVTERGRAALAGLRRGPVDSPVTGLLARRLVDAGLAHPVPPRAPRQPEITVVVPVHERAVQLDRCLAGLGGRHPVVVVDDASSDAKSIAAVAHRHGAGVLRREVNGGPGAARNSGLAAVTSEYIAFVDSDTVPDARCLDALAVHLLDPLVAAVAPRIRSLGGGRCGLDLGARPASVRPYGPVSFVPSTVLLVRRAALTDTFDESMRQGEDVDLVWRLLAAQWRIRYEPGVTVAHDEPSSRTALLRRRFGYGTSAAPLGLKHPQNVAPMLVHPQFTATVAAALAGRPWLALAGAAASVARTERAVRRAGLPRSHLVRATLNGIRQTHAGMGSYARQFAGPILVAALLGGNRSRRLAAASLLVRRPDALLDDIAYGAGVLTGCVRHRTLLPLLPRLIRTESMS